MKILARFVPQLWLNNYAVDSDDVIEFDITEQIKEMGKEKALRIKNDTYEADDLWSNSPDHNENHDGPFKILCEEQIRRYFSTDFYRVKIQGKWQDQIGGCVGSIANCSVHDIELKFSDGQRRWFRYSETERVSHLE